MIIQEIKLENFRQYKGEITIGFSTSAEKNVTVIIGDNTCGKTTLVQSFIWCLYNHADFKDKKLLNAEEYEDLGNKVDGSKKDCAVRVSISHNNTTYIIERIETYKVNKGRIDTTQKFTIYDDSKKKNCFMPIDLQDERDIITSILPENLSDYFFFWGERIEKLSDRKELTQAVKQFLGLDTIELAQKHLKNVISSMSSNATNGSSDSEINACDTRINNYRLKNAQLEREIRDIKNNVSFYKDKREQYFKELTTSENKELQVKQNDYKAKLGQLNTKKSELAKSNATFRRKFNDSRIYVYALANKMEQKAVTLLKDNPEPVVGWKYIDINAISEIIKRGKCICGNEICENNDAYNHLMEQMKLVAPNQVGGAINSFIEGSESRQALNNNYYETIHDTISEIREREDEISDLKDGIEKLSREIESHDDLEEVKKKYESCDQKYNEYSSKLGAKQAELDNNNRQIDLNERKKDRLMSQNKKYERSMKEIRLARDVLESFNVDYKDDEQKLMSSLQKHVNENFQQVYSGNRIIQIDEKYNAIPLNNVNGKWIKSETSPGLETVKNFSFIAGLVQCAKEKIVESDDYISSIQNKYPLVLDAPFSQADEKHIPAISKLLSNNAEQIILVVMEKDWNYAKDILSDKVGKKYRLKKISETHTEVIEEERDD